MPPRSCTDTATSAHRRRRVGVVEQLAQPARRGVRVDIAAARSALCGQRPVARRAEAASRAVDPREARARQRRDLFQNVRVAVVAALPRDEVDQRCSRTVKCASPASARSAATSDAQNTPSAVSAT
jgi:hypothetical protein